MIGSAIAQAEECENQMKEISVTEVGPVQIGQVEEKTAETGCVGAGL